MKLTIMSCHCSDMAVHTSSFLSLLRYISVSYLPIEVLLEQGTIGNIPSLFDPVGPTLSSWFWMPNQCVDFRRSTVHRANYETCYDCASIDREGFAPGQYSGDRCHYQIYR
eukprot:GHVT01004138.1.p2 GENE.GHVT01004138.1~~GHVT01004138.1.p2  ORF type:complete len:111 (-),score=0.43 GHVT01004138.1:1033-1365(-)